MIYRECWTEGNGSKDFFSSQCWLERLSHIGQLKPKYAIDMTWIRSSDGKRQIKPRFCIFRAPRPEETASDSASELTNHLYNKLFRRLCEQFIAHLRSQNAAKIKTEFPTASTLTSLPWRQYGGKQQKMVHTRWRKKWFCYDRSYKGRILLRLNTYNRR